MSPFRRETAHSSVPLLCARLSRLFVLTLALGALLCGCSHPTMGSWSDFFSKERTIRVRKGDTLYSISWQYGYDYRSFARYNHISAPFKVREGQILRRMPPSRVKKIWSSFRFYRQISPSRGSSLKKSWWRSLPKGDWVWPTRGRILRSFDPSDTRHPNKGIDIAGRRSQTIVACADGKVVYAGQGLRGYGKLLIIKHGQDFMSAYAHSDRLRVKQGDRVKAGQPIADMGDSDSADVRLHFEIRHAGVSINPMDILPPLA